MATFKVGQRARLIGSRWYPEHVGLECTVLGVWNYKEIWIEIDGVPSDIPEIHGWLALREHLAPLTDPGADAFIERIKKLKPEPIVPLPERVTAK